MSLLLVSSVKKGNAVIALASPLW